MTTLNCNICGHMSSSETRIYRIQKFSQYTFILYQCPKCLQDNSTKFLSQVLK
jgi:hypothetical protein